MCYVYDVTGRLTTVTYNDGSSISYIYDANGSRLSSTTKRAVNQVPVANDDVAIAVIDTPADIDVLANDTDVDGTVCGEFGIYFGMDQEVASAEA